VEMAVNQQSTTWKRIKAGIKIQSHIHQQKSNSSNEEKTIYLPISNM